MPCAGEARDDGARVHVHHIVACQQAFDLPQGDPAEIHVFRHALLQMEDDVPVAFAEKPGALLGLELIEDDLFRLYRLEGIQVHRPPSLVHLV